MTQFILFIYDESTRPQFSRGFIGETDEERTIHRVAHYVVGCERERGHVYSDHEYDLFKQTTMPGGFIYDSWSDPLNQETIHSVVERVRHQTAPKLALATETTEQIAARRVARLLHEARTRLSDGNSIDLTKLSAAFDAADHWHDAYRAANVLHPEPQPDRS